MSRRALGAAPLALALALGACTADLRHPTLVERPPTDEARARGRQLLNNAAARHGMAAWQGFATAEFIFRDDWDSALAAVLGLEPWDAEDEVRIRVMRGGFDSRVDFVGGPRAGEVWGLWGADWWAIEDGVVEREEEDGEGFVVRAMVFLFTAPMRLADAEIVVYDSEVRAGSRTYDRVLATWGSLEPNDADQYRVWIDRGTGRVDLVDFTVRDKGGFLTGRAIFADYRRVDGVLVPFDVTITDVGKTTDDPFLHRVQLKQVRFDAFAPAELAPPTGGAAPPRAPPPSSQPASAPAP